MTYVCAPSTSGSVRKAFDHLIMRKVQDWGVHSYFRYAWVCICIRTTEVWSMGTSRLVRYIKVYVIASQYSMELMLFQCGLSAIIRNSEVYVISRVVISRFDLYNQSHMWLAAPVTIISAHTDAMTSSKRDEGVLPRQVSPALHLVHLSLALHRLIRRIQRGRNRWRWHMCLSTLPGLPGVSLDDCPTQTQPEQPAEIKLTYQTYVTTKVQKNSPALKFNFTTLQCKIKSPIISLTVLAKKATKYALKKTTELIITEYSK